VQNEQPNGECASGKRNRFFRNKKMKAEVFTTDHAYFIGRRRLVNRAVLGWGVVYGFPMSGSPITVGKGFALDRHGREIVVAAPVALDRSNTFAIDSGGPCRTTSLDGLAPGRYVLAAHYAERLAGPTYSPDPCGCDRPEREHICETVVFALRPLGDDGRCPCAEEACERTCTCRPHDLDPEDPAQLVDPCGGAGRGPHACLCEWVTGAAPPDSDSWCTWNDYTLDLTDGVDLACVTVAQPPGKCEPLALVVDDACSPRKLVKNNDLLYDLIRGCDLTHISDVSWHPWHRSREVVPWADFAAMLEPDAKPGFAIEFSAPVLVDTLRRDAVLMTVFTVDSGTGWRIPRRLPLRIDADSPDGKTTQRIRLLVAQKWSGDEGPRSGESLLAGRRFTVEIEVRGDLILDCHGQPVDADAVGLRAMPSGDGMPGGTYVSSFRVEGRPVDSTDDSY
jgi:hypothetical protein